MEEIKQVSYNAKYYNAKIKSNPEFYERNEREYVNIFTIDTQMTKNTGRKF